MTIQNEIIKTIKQKPIKEVREKYFESKNKLSSRDIQKLYNTTSGFNFNLYNNTKKYFDKKIINDGKGLKTNQTGLNFLGYQRLIAMTLNQYS